MTPRIINAFPPNYNVLRRAFPWMIGRAIFFAYGDTIYNPKRAMIGKSKIAHETVHCERQGDDPAAWWGRYIDDRAFRLEEEILAHRAEWQELRKHINNERLRKVMLRSTALALGSPLYGSLIGEAEAIKVLDAASFTQAPPPTPMGAYDIKISYGT